MEGHPVEQIAALRNLSPSTIAGHLAFYIQQGKIPVEQLMNASRISIIQQAIEKVGGNILTPVKDLLGEDYSFNEIRYVMAYMERTTMKVES